MKKLNNYLIIALILYLCFEVISNSSSVTSSAILAIDIWKNNIFPSLFPFFVLSNILINYGFTEILSKIFRPLMKLFKVSACSSFILVMSIFSGFPSSAKYTKDLFDKKLIDEKEASKVLMFTHFSNPLFIINTIGIMFLNNKRVGLYILIVHYLVNILIGLLFRNYLVSNNKKELNNNNLESKNFGEIISNSILSSLNTLLLILGSITFFLILTTAILNKLQVDLTIKAVISGIFEMTQGLKAISILSLSLKIKTIISAMFISFGGLAIHIQIYSILSETKIKYLPFLISRVIHALIVGILIFFTFDFFIS